MFFYYFMANKILIFSITYLPFVGGAELAIKEETDRIKDVQFDMVTLRFDSSLPRYERIGNVNVYRIGFTLEKPTMADLVKFPLMINKLLFPFTACLKALSLHRETKYDAVWAMMAAYAGFAAMFFKLLKPKVSYLLTLQEGDPIDYILNKVKFVRPLFNRIFTKADHIQAISTYLGNWARSMGFKGVMDIIPNAVATAHFTQSYPESELAALESQLNKQLGDVFIITTSRLVLKNAADDVIKALPLLPANVKFLILGTGPDEAMLKSLAKELKVENRAIFYGHVDHKDMPKFLKVSDIFIRPSLSEGLGNSFLEAMAAEIPVIATPVGGIPDFLFDPEKNPDQEPTGLFCNVRDPESIAVKIKTYIEDNALRARIIKNAKAMVLSRYDWEIIARDMAGVFAKL